MSLTSVKGLHAGITIAYNSFDDSPFGKSNFKASFEYYANSLIIPQIKEWQQKRDFETTAQYQARVTKENLDKKIQELIAQAIGEYTEKNPIKPSLGTYDADYELYKINSNYGEKFVKVPLAEAPTFKSKFDKATFDATYVVTDDGLRINALTVKMHGKNGKHYRAAQSSLSLASNNIDIDLPEISLPVSQPSSQPTVAQPIRIDNSLDVNIPSVAANNKQTFAVIIGNEKYQQVAQVPYAGNDAKVFAEYCQKTLGLPKENVRSYADATFGTMLSAMSDIKSIAQAYKGNINVIFYYAGHGVPNEQSHDAFLLPVDADGRQTEACYPVSRLYQELGELGAKNVVVFMDACFSGAQRGDGMLAVARGVALKTNAAAPKGNMVVFSAATGDETAYPYNEKGHGLFTYFLLKKLQETKGECTLGDLGEYIQQQVSQQSVVINRKSQTPTIVPSTQSADWRNWKLR